MSVAIILSKAVGLESVFTDRAHVGHGQINCGNRESTSSNMHDTFRQSVSGIYCRRTTYYGIHVDSHKHVVPCSVVRVAFRNGDFP